MKPSALIPSFNLITAAVLLLFSTMVVSQTISLSPNIGPPTTKTLASGSGFLPNATVRISFDRTKLVQVTTDALGAFSKVSLQVPASALPGKHSVLAGVPGSTQAQTTFLVRTNWSQFHFSADHKGFNMYENVLSPANVGGLQLLWTVNGAFDLSPTVANGVLYGGHQWAVDAELYAMDPKTGTLLWEYATDLYPNSPTVANGVVYIATFYGFVYAVDATSHTLLWTYRVPQGNSFGLTVANGTVYIPDADDLYALDARSGALLWENPISTATLPTVAGGVVYVGSVDQNLYAFAADTGALLWQYTTGGQIQSLASAVANGVVYVGSNDYNLYALDASTGALLWRYTTGSAVETSPAVAYGLVYFGSYDSYLYALNANTGALVWKYKTGDSFGTASPAVANGVVYFGSRDQNLYAAEAKTGKLLWQYACDQEPDSLLVADGTLYTNCAYLHAFGLTGSK